jgi:hypothetical protein
MEIVVSQLTLTSLKTKAKRRIQKVRLFENRDHAKKIELTILKCTKDFLHMVSMAYN